MLPTNSTQVDQGMRMYSDGSYDEPQDDKEDGDIDEVLTTNHNLSCQQCRLRKIKCDRKNPCTQCVRKKADCLYPSGSKPRQKRQRVLVSTNYEHKINNMSKKLDNLCQIIETNHSPANKSIRYSKSLMFYWAWDIDTVGQLLEYVTTAYTSKPSTAELVIVYSTLSRLFYECIRGEPSASGREQLKTHARHCEENLVLIISRLPFNLATTFDNILALYYITIYMMSQCKPLAAWRYISSSIQMCQTLGYYRERALIPEIAQQTRRRQRLVWMIIIVDKTLSLRLTRPSNIREIDIMLLKPSEISQDDVSAFSFLSLLPKWIDAALLQGQVYDDLFSPRALGQPEENRATRARTLAADLQRVFEAMDSAENQVMELRRRNIGDDIHELFLRADRINHLVTLTLVYRAIPGGSYSNSVFSDECVTTAARALNEHKNCLATLKCVDGEALELYFQWAILLSPFIPFIVIFWRTLETSDSSYLETLFSVVETFDLLPTSLPKPYRVQIMVFKAMYEVACEYIESKQNLQPVNNRKMPETETVPADVHFGDMSSLMQQNPSYNAIINMQNNDHTPTDTLSALYPHDTSHINAYSLSQTVDAGMELGTWMDQNQRMFNMLEDMF